MKVAILTQHFLPAHEGGCERAAYNLAAMLANRGHAVHVITSQENPVKSPAETDYSEFYVRRLSVPDLPLLRSVAYGVQAFRVITTLNPDLVHAQTISLFNTGVATTLVGLLTDVPYVVWGQGTDVYGATKWHALVERPFQRYILRHANAALALTADMRDRMEKVYPETTVEVIPNGIDVEAFTSVVSSETSGVVGGEVTTLLFVGRLHPVKGLSYLIDAMTTIIETEPDVELVIVGDGPEHEALESRVRSAGIGEKVRFVGRVSNDVVAEYMAAADVFVLPSLSEGFPLVVLEAMASGLPIVAADTRGLSEIIEPGWNGLLASPGDVNDLANQLRTIIQKDSLREFIGNRNRETVDNYRWSHIIEQVERVHQASVRNHTEGGTM
jgi:glycosyltransferase involved in cell wall biosynthesis